MYIPHYRVTCSGTLYSQGGSAQPLEIFSYGFQIGSPGTGPSAVLPAMEAVTFTTLVGVIAAYHGRAGTAIAPACTLERVKVASILQSGHYAAAPQEAMTNTAGGGSSGYLHPFQVAYAVSLTGVPAVRPRRGRWYVPAPNLGLDTATGGMSGAARDNALASALQLVNDVNSTVDSTLDGFRVVVASQDSIVGAATRPAENSVVSQVRVGRVFDTQRRRRNNLVEVYASGTPTP